MKRKQHRLKKLESGTVGTLFVIHTVNGVDWAYAAGVPVRAMPRVKRWMVIEEWRKVSGYEGGRHG